MCSSDLALGPCLATIAVALVSSVSLHAQEMATAGSAAAADMPYSGIIARNMFGLLPIPVHHPEDDLPPADPPPKITPNGIMTIFGKDQVLFKVAAKPKPGQPAKEDSHVMAEGEMEDDITVVKIDHVNAVITFNNHGTMQDIPLVAAKDTGGAAPPGSAPPGRMLPGVVPQPGFIPPPRPGMGGVPGRSFGPAANPSFGGNPGASVSPGGPMNVGSSSGSPSAGGLNFGSEVNEKGIYQPSVDTSTTPEQNAILMEAQRNQYLQNGNSRFANMIPTTKYTEQLNPSGQQ